MVQKNDYSDEEFLKAETYYKLLSNDQKNKLSDNILKGLPGSEEDYSIEAFREILKTYNNINSDQLKKKFSFIFESHNSTCKKKWNFDVYSSR